jgi:hypothetical protein
MCGSEEVAGMGSSAVLWSTQIWDVQFTPTVPVLHLSGRVMLSRTSVTTAIGPFHKSDTSS